MLVYWQPPLALKMSFHISILFATPSFFAQTRFFSTTIDSSLHPQWQVTNSSAGRDGAYTFCISCSFTKGFSILFLKRTFFFTAIDSNMHPQWQWQWLTVLLAIEKGNQRHWFDPNPCLIWFYPLLSPILAVLVKTWPWSVSQSVNQWVSECHFRISTQRVTFETWDPSDIWLEWRLDEETKRKKYKNTERQKHKKTKGQKDKKTKRSKRPKKSLILWCQGSFALLRCFFSSSHPFWSRSHLSGVDLNL